MLLIDNEFATQPDGSDTFSDGRLVGSENGRTSARIAAQQAARLGAPAGTALFANIEAKALIDEAWILGWYETLAAGEYQPGFYANPLPENSFSGAFCSAGRTEPSLFEEAFIWTAQDQTGRSDHDGQPPFSQAVRPSCGGTEVGRTVVFQYGVVSDDGVVPPGTPAVDTDIALGEALDLLWRP